MNIDTIEEEAKEALNFTISSDSDSSDSLFEFRDGPIAMCVDSLNSSRELKDLCMCFTTQDLAQLKSTHSSSSSSQRQLEIIGDHTIEQCGEQSENGSLNIELDKEQTCPVLNINQNDYGVTAQEQKNIHFFENGVQETQLLSNPRQLLENDMLMWAKAVQDKIIDCELIYREFYKEKRAENLENKALTLKENELYIQLIILISQLSSKISRKLNSKLLKEFKVEESEYIKAHSKYTKSVFYNKKFHSQENILFNSDKPIFSKERVLEMVKFIEEQEYRLRDEYKINSHKYNEATASLVYQSKLDDLLHSKYGITYDHLANCMKFHAVF